MKNEDRDRMTTMQLDPDIAFLEEAARYFENRPTGEEDRAHWSNVYNAENCRRIAKRLNDNATVTRKMSEAMAAIQYEARREKGSWVHLRRCIAAQCDAAMSNTNGESNGNVGRG